MSNASAKVCITRARVAQKWVLPEVSALAVESGEPTAWL